MCITEADLRVGKEFESEIERHLQIVTELRHRLNSLVRINRLPPELLAEIFYFCQVEPWNRHEDESKFKPIGTQLRWIFILCVCHHWREIALATPRLWARVPLDHTRFAIECIIHAKSSPLHLVANRWYPEQSAFFEHIAHDPYTLCRNAISYSSFREAYLGCQQPNSLYDLSSQIYSYRESSRTAVRASRHVQEL